MKTVTVRELLASLPDTQIYAGCDGLDKAINTISFIDAPSSVDWLNGGEIILTTAFLFKEDDKVQAEYIQKMIDMDVVALGIKIGRYIDRLPVQVLETANLHNFPIFGIRYDAVWSEIFNAFHSLCMNKQNERSILSRKIFSFERLFRSSNWGDEAIRSHFLECVGISAAIVNNAYRVISANRGSAVDTVILYCERRSRYHRQEYSPEQIIVAHEKKRRKIYDVTLYRGERLVLCTEEGEGIRDSELEWITILYKSVRNKNKYAQDSPALWKEFLQEFIVGNCAENFKEYTRALSLHDNQTSIFLIISGSMKEEACNEFKRMQRLVLPREVVRDAVINNEIVLLCTLEAAEDAFGFVNRLRCKLNKVAAEFPDVNIRVGSPVDKLESLRLSYDNARKADKLSKLLLLHKEVVFYSDIEIFQRLCAMEQDYHEIISLQQQITSFDACKTLEIYLENSNIKRAAECAYIHDNTMRYRLQKIEQCLNIDINNPVNRLNLLLKLKLWHIMAAGDETTSEPF